MKYDDARILVFCRAPVVGQVKTRLIPALGEEGATALHAELAQRTLGTCLESRLAPVDLWCEPDIHDPFYRAPSLQGVKLHPQVGHNLGERMLRALLQALSAPNIRRAILVGTDLPTLNADYLDRAIACLADHDAVIGPAEDGGYGLIGLSEARVEVFDGIVWGSDKVCAETCRRFNQLGMYWTLMPRLWDVDLPEDVARYRALES